MKTETITIKVVAADVVEENPPVPEPEVIVPEQFVPTFATSLYYEVLFVGEVWDWELPKIAKTEPGLKEISLEIESPLDTLFSLDKEKMTIKYNGGDFGTGDWLFEGSFKVVLENSVGKKTYV